MQQISLFFPLMWKEIQSEAVQDWEGSSALAGHPSLLSAAPLSLVSCLIFQNGCLNSSQGAHSRKEQKKVSWKTLIFSLRNSLEVAA